MLAFALATISSNTQLIKATAKGALLDPKLDTYNGITPAWRSHLVRSLHPSLLIANLLELLLSSPQKAWQAAQTEKIFKLIRSYSDNVPGHYYTSGCQDAAKENVQVWQTLIVPALRDFNLAESSILPVSKRLIHAKACDHYKRQLEPWLITFEKKTSEWIEFPV